MSGQNSDANATEPAVQSNSGNEESRPDPEAVTDMSFAQTGSSNLADGGGDGDSSDDETKRPGRRDLAKDEPRGRRKARSSSDEHEEHEDRDAYEMNQKQLVTVKERRTGRSDPQFTIKIDRSHLPLSSKVKIKKAFLRMGSQSAARGRRRSHANRAVVVNFFAISYGSLYFML